MNTVRWTYRGWFVGGVPFVRAWDRFELVHERVTTRDDRMEQFGILELRLPLGPAPPVAPDGRMVVENQELRATWPVACSFTYPFWLYPDGFLACEAGAGCYSFFSHLNDDGIAARVRRVGDGSDE